MEIHYTCGFCNQPVITYWSKEGLEYRDYLLLGEVFFHKGDCASVYLEEINNYLGHCDPIKERT